MGCFVTEENGENCCRFTYILSTDLKLPWLPQKMIDNVSVTSLAEFMDLMRNHFRNLRSWPILEGHGRSLYCENDMKNLLSESEFQIFSRTPELIFAWKEEEILWVFFFYTWFKKKLNFVIDKKKKWQCSYIIFIRMDFNKIANYASDYKENV